jgi:hypothetical protein
LAESITVQIQFEMGQIDRLFEFYAGLLADSRQRVPDLVEMTALGSVLHSFYNGVENIFLAVAKEVDRGAPRGAEWHRTLLTSMTQVTSNRGPVISAETAVILSGYLIFRHFYRHAYAFFLDWSKMRSLVIALADVWAQTKQELLAFVETQS